MTNSTPGRILFVGAGPGNPDLLTVRAREVLTSIADAWVDDGVGESICRLVGHDVPVPREKVEEAEQEFARMVEEAKAKGSRRRPTPLHPRRRRISAVRKVIPRQRRTLCWLRLPRALM